MNNCTIRHCSLENCFEFLESGRDSPISRFFQLDPSRGDWEGIIGPGLTKSVTDGLDVERLGIMGRFLEELAKVESRCFLERMTGWSGERTVSTTDIT